MLNDRDSASKSMRRSMKKFEKMSVKASESKLQIKKQQVHNEAKRVQDIDVNIEDKVLQFEERRIENYKAILHDLLKSQIFYHAKALESLSKAFKHVKDIDHIEGVDFLAREISLSAEQVQQVKTRRRTSTFSAPRSPL